MHKLAKRLLCFKKQHRYDPVVNAKIKKDLIQCAYSAVKVFPPDSSIKLVCLARSRLAG